MKIKQNVILAGLDIRMRPVLVTADKLWKEYGKELVVTSGLDGTHSAGSLHYYGLALDFRTYYFPEDQRPEIAQELQTRLGKFFQVILEDTHIHVEWAGRL